MTPSFILSRMNCLSGDNSKSLSERVPSILADDEVDSEITEIPLLEVSKEILDMVVEILNYHQIIQSIVTISKPIQSTDIKAIVGEWDANCINLDKEQETLFKIILAAQYLSWNL